MENDHGLGEALPTNEFPPPAGVPMNEFPPPAGVPAGVPINEFPPPQIKTNTLPAPKIEDTLFAAFLAIMGFCFWNWQILSASYKTGIGVTLFFCLLLVGTLIFLQRKGIKQTKNSLLLFGLAAAATMPFVLFDSREINTSLLLFEGCLCLLWLSVSCKTLMATKLTALFAFDAFSQVMIIPFANFGQIFTRSAKSHRIKSVWSQILFAVVGLLISLPILFVVLKLLLEADAGFSQFIRGLELNFNYFNLLDHVFEFILGIPVACYVFGAVVGNAFKNHSSAFEKESLEGSFVRAHVIPRVALYGLLMLLILIYVTFFIATAGYLFSAFRGSLPGEFTFAEYARQGFFELCWVAVINLGILGVTWIFARREKQEYPVFLRVLTGLIVALTCLLIITAASKMWLYIQAYGLTLLRFYTSWFMGLLLIVFVLVLAWHFRPYNVAKPVVIATIALVFALAFTNINGIIARYNVDQYLSGQAETVDIQMLANLSCATVPALRDLQAQATDPEVKQEVREALRRLERNQYTIQGDTLSPAPWHEADLMSFLIWSE